MINASQIKDSSKIFNTLKIISSLKSLKTDSGSSPIISRKKYLEFIKKTLKTVSYTHLRAHET